jgi:hypothetical protein
MYQFYPKPLSIPLGPFQIFSKIRGDIRSSRCITGVIVDTGGAPRIANIYANFRTNSKDPDVIFRGLWKMIHD